MAGPDQGITLPTESISLDDPASSDARTACWSLRALAKKGRQGGLLKFLQMS